jgi:hypothetical protein
MQGNSFNSFRFNIYELIAAMISLATLAVGITLWTTQTFLSKEEYKEHKISVERRLDFLESEIRSMNHVITSVAKDVSYIRGKLEPK